jgi:hypothetical protein
VVRALTRCALLCATSGKESSMPGSRSDGPFVSTSLAVVRLSVSGETGDMDFKSVAVAGAELAACRSWKQEIQRTLDASSLLCYFAAGPYWISARLQQVSSRSSKSIEKHHNEHLSDPHRSPAASRNLLRYVFVLVSVSEHKLK